MDRIDALVAAHRRFLSFLERRVGRREDAEDILQAAFVKALERGESVRDDESAVAWFYRLLRNALTDHYRREAAGGRALAGRASMSPAENVEQDADLERTVCACIEDLVPTLRPAYAELIRRVDLGGEEVGALAGMLGVTPGNARVRLHRARAALREKVERACRTCAEHGCLDCTCGRGAHP